MTPRPLSEPRYDEQQAEAPTGPTCSRCGCRAELLVGDPFDDFVALPAPEVFSCPTDGEFYLDSEGWSTRQVFLDDSAPTHAVPVGVATELDGDEEVEF